MNREILTMSSRMSSNVSLYIPADRLPRHLREDRMRQAGKIGAWLVCILAATSCLAYLVRFAYREMTVQTALEDAQRFPTARPSRAPVHSDPLLLQRLRPHPWSSPLHDRRFDGAIAGARAAYDAGDYDRAIALNTRALEIRPSQDLVWLLLTRRAECYSRKNEPDQALADYEE